MADELAIAARSLNELSGFMKDFGDACSDSESIDDLAVKLATRLNIDVSMRMEGQTPLAPTTEEAEKERKTGDLTKAAKLESAVAERVEEIAR
jgi:hypothetical protein